MRHTRRVKKANKSAEWVEKAGPAAARSRWRVEMAPNTHGLTRTRR